MGRRPWEPSQPQVAEIDRLIADRKSNSAIARALGVSAATIARFLLGRRAAPDLVVEPARADAEITPPMTPAELALACRANAYEALRSLLGVMRDPAAKASARLAAAGAILDYAHGRPSVETGISAQMVFADFETPSPDEFATSCRSFTSEALNILREILERGTPATARVKAGRMLIARGAGLAPPASSDPFAPRAGGVKTRAAIEAMNAGVGTDWGDDLLPEPPPAPRRDH